MHIETQIPVNILEDYLKIRERNFSVNKNYLEWQSEGIFDFLVFTRDDTAEFGLNIIEADYLAQYAKVHTGFDEVMLTILTRVLAENFNKKIKIFTRFSTENGGKIIPRYEEKILEKTTEFQIKMCGAEPEKIPEKADLVLLVHTPVESQNDLALEEFVELDSISSVDFCINYILDSNKPVILADVKNANGSDSLLVSNILKQDLDLYGYAGWNTASNTIGTALATGITRYIAEKENSFCVEAFNRAIFARFVDDCAYQSLIRNMVRKFNLNPDHISLTFPWKRNFEVEICF